MGAGLMFRWLYQRQLASKVQVNIDINNMNNIIIVIEFIISLPSFWKCNP
jgi:hypothetical protein